MVVNYISCFQCNKQIIDYIYVFHILKNKKKSKEYYCRECSISIRKYYQDFRRFLGIKKLKVEKKKIIKKHSIDGGIPENQFKISYDE